jgi:exopolyphosphatase/pppGpp-phosphohydrolase
MINDITKKDSSLIESAALLHDVEKVFLKDYDEDHHKKGAKYIKTSDFLDCKKHEKKLIYLMVRWHKGDSYINKDYSKKQIRMIEIVRAADKISKIYKKSIEDCAYSIIKDISCLQKKKVKKAAAVVLLERVKSLNKNDY